MTNANAEKRKRKKPPKWIIAYTLTNYKKIGIKEFLQKKLYWHVLRTQPCPPERKMFDCCAAIVNFRRIQCLNDVDFRRSKQTACLVSRTSVFGGRERCIYGVNTRSRRRPNGADAPYGHHVAERGVASCCRVPRDRRSRSQSRLQGRRRQWHNDEMAAEQSQKQRDRDRGPGHGCMPFTPRSGRLRSFVVSTITGSPYSITERRVPELVPVLGSQPAGESLHTFFTATQPRNHSSCGIPGLPQNLSYNFRKYKNESDHRRKSGLPKPRGQ